ncbi:hypothetical protein NDU88_003286 [Pleurodeles waltl]|uniref:Uncharacterized protein n=1 Tax=Pleurodeles waltl TaxID=8319 RepID=A0AAV7MQR8_PLEWA|nr:hypothetical protein NDU88_003286 [Pleurodeles waltl]
MRYPTLIFFSNNTVMNTLKPNNQFVMFSSTFGFLSPEEEGLASLSLASTSLLLALINENMSTKSPFQIFSFTSVLTCAARLPGLDSNASVDPSFAELSWTGFLLILGNTFESTGVALTTVDGVGVTRGLFDDAWDVFEGSTSANAFTWCFSSNTEFCKESLATQGVLGGGVLLAGPLMLANSLDTSNKACLDELCTCACCSRAWDVGGGKGGAAGNGTTGRGAGGAPDCPAGDKEANDLRIFAKTSSTPIAGATVVPTLGPCCAGGVATTGTGTTVGATSVGGLTTAD